MFGFLPVHLIAKGLLLSTQQRAGYSIWLFEGRRSVFELRSFQRGAGDPYLSPELKYVNRTPYSSMGISLLKYRNNRTNHGPNRAGRAQTVQILVELKTRFRVKVTMPFSTVDLEATPGP